MVSFVIPITVLVLCGISTILFVQDTNEHPCRSGIEPPASLSTKPVIAYSCIMVVATFVVSVVFVILFKELDVFATLKRMILLCVIWPLAYIDYKTYRIPNTFILYGLICRAVLIPIELMFNPYFRVDIISELIAAAALFAAALLCAVCMRGSIGAGDMKLFLVMGIYLQTSPADEPIYQFMDKKRSEGKPYKVYMMASANKFLRIYYATVKAYLNTIDEA